MTGNKFTDCSDPLYDPKEEDVSPGGFRFCLRVFLVLFLSGGILYFRILGSPFLWDEYHLILANAYQGAFDWNRIPNLFAQRYFFVPGSLNLDLFLVNPFYRPISVLFYLLSYKAFGFFYPAYHLESLALHIANALLVLFLFLKLSSSCFPSRYSTAAVLAATLIFFVHPRDVMMVSIIANQPGLLCTFFSLVSLCFWVRILEGVRRPFLLYGVSLLALLLAMLSKEAGYVVPLLHALVFLLHAREQRKSHWLLVCGYFLLLGIPFSLRHHVIAGPPLGSTLLRALSRKGSLFPLLGSVLALLLHQLDQWFLPVSTRIFLYSFFPETLSLREILLPVFACGAMVWVLRKHRRLLILGFGWFLVVYLPSSNLIPQGQLTGGGMKTGSHHLYMAQAGLTLLVSCAFFSLYNSLRERGLNKGYRSVLCVFAGLLIVTLSVQTFRFTGYFQNADRFYQGILERNPVYFSAWQNYAWHKLHLDDDPVSAENILLQGLETTQGHGYGYKKMDLMKLLMKKYVMCHQTDEAETLLQCVMDDWVTDPVGSLYFWLSVQRLDKDTAGR